MKTHKELESVLDICVVQFHLAFVDEEVYDVMYRYDVTSYDVTSNDASIERHSEFELDPRLLIDQLMTHKQQ